MRNQARMPAWNVFAAAGGLVLVAAPAEGRIVLDDFTRSAVPEQYPATSTPTSPTFEPTEVDDPFGSDANGAGRIVILTPVLNPDQASSGEFDGLQTVTLDTNAGRLTSTSAGDGAPLLFLIYAGLEEADPGTSALDLDVRGEEGVLIRYQTNLDVDANLRLANGEDGDPADEVSGNDVGFTFEAGSRSVFLPFRDIDGVLTERDFSSFPFVDRELPALDLASLDTFTLSINPIDAGNDVPEGLVLSFDSIEFVPEPGTAALLGGLGCLLARRRRG